MPDEDGRSRFGSAVARALDEQGHSRSWLGAEVARLEGLGDPISGASVSKWVGGNPPAPDRVFVIERALGMKPGALSRHLGYLPASARSTRTVLDALADDGDLSDMARQVITAVYRTYKEGTP